MKQIKNILWILLAISVLAVGGWWFLSDGVEHIEDSNGPDNTELAVITDENIINMDMGALNVERSTGLLNDGVTISSDKFTGVYEVFLTNYVGKSDLLIDLAGFHVTGGNFKMAVVNEGKIIATIEPGLFAECHLEDLTGTTALRIAGESAAFTFSMDRLFCEEYHIEING